MGYYCWRKKIVHQVGCKICILYHDARSKIHQKSILLVSFHFISFDDWWFLTHLRTYCKALTILLLSQLLLQILRVERNCFTSFQQLILSKDLCLLTEKTHKVICDWLSPNRNSKLVSLDHKNMLYGTWWHADTETRVLCVKSCTWAVKAEVYVVLGRMKIVPSIWVSSDHAI
jgi:hypothetical protein